MNTRLLPALALTWLALACSDPPQTTPTPGGSGGMVGGGAGGAAGGLAGSAGAGTAGTGGAAGGMGGGGAGGGGMTKATQLKDSGLFTASAMGTLPDGVTVGPMLTLAADIHAFTPQYALWSDDSGKRRWVYMPPGKKITTDFDGPVSMDYWRYPAGFKLWKEFSRDGKVIETRLLEKLGDGAQDWYMVAFLWNADYADAVAVPLGQPNAMGTMHDVPGEEGCKGCHTKMVDNALGFSALQLSHNLPGSLNLEQISTMGWLSTPPTGMYTLPGTEVEKAAFGYLHANCGTCHNTRSNIYTTSADLDLWTHLTELQGGTVATLRAYLSMVCDEWPGAGNKTTPIKMCTAGHATGTRVESDLSQLTKRIAPGNAAMSAVHELMGLRVAMATEDARQMPPIGTEIVDPMGMAALEAWINALPVE